MTDIREGTFMEAVEAAQKGASIRPKRESGVWFFIGTSGYFVLEWESGLRDSPHMPTANHFLGPWEIREPAEREVGNG